MDWPQVLTIVGANIVLIVGMISITISLFLHSDKKMETALKAINDEMKDFHNKYMEETRSFHGRLVSIEERTRKDILKT